MLSRSSRFCALKTPKPSKFNHNWHIVGNSYCRRSLTDKANPADLKVPFNQEWKGIVEKELKGKRKVEDLIWHTPEVKSNLIQIKWKLIFLGNIYQASLYIR